VGDENGTLCPKPLALKRRKFSSREKPKPKGLFIAICEKQKDYLYETHFGNDSNPIDVIVETAKYEYREIPPFETHDFV